MDRDEKEKELLFQWACRNYSTELTQKIFSPKGKDENSYFIKRDKGECYLREYMFQELPELREELGQMWNDDKCMKEILLPVLVGAFKNQVKIERYKEEPDRFTIADELPPYIYGF